MTSGLRSASRRRADVLWRAVAAGLAGAVVAGGSVAGAAAQEAPEPGGVGLTVSHLTTALGPGSVRAGVDDLDPHDLPSRDRDLDLRVLVENTGESRLDALQLVVEIYPAATSRSALRQALDGSPGAAPVHVHSVPVRDGAALEPGDVAGVRDQFPEDEVAWAPEGGVHPVRIAALRGTDVLAEAVTAVVWVADVPASPLLTTVVWPVDDVPWRTSGGRYPAAVDGEVRPGGRLDVLLRTLERRPDARVVLAPAAHLLEDLRDRADGFVARERQGDGSIEVKRVEPEDPPARTANDTLQRIRELASELPLAPVTGGYAHADLSALLAEGDVLADLAAEAAVGGRQRLQALLDREPDPSTYLVGGTIDARTVDLLPGEQLLLPFSAVVGPEPVADPDLAPPLRSLRSASGRLLTGLVADPYLTASLESPDGSAGPIVDAQRVVAETAMIYFEAPRATGRSLLVLPPEIWAPPPEFAREVLDGLLDATWLELSSPAEQGTAGRASGAAIEFPDNPTTTLPTSLRDELVMALDGLQSVLEAQVGDDAEIDDRPADELREALLRATSRRLQGTGLGEAEALVRDVRRAVDTTFGDVEVAAGSRITLTSDSGQIPITLQRTRGGPIAVQLEVVSQGRLEWPDGRRSETIVLEDGEARTVSFRTRALSTGTFPVTVLVTDPSGGRELDRTTLSVRSTSISGPALSATGAAVVLLLLAGLVRRRRTGGRRRLQVVQ